MNIDDKKFWLFKLNITPAQTILVRELIKETIDPSEEPSVFPKTYERINNCSAEPKTWSIIMMAIAELLDGSVQAILSEESNSSIWGNVLYMYIDRGNTSISTIIFDVRRTLFFVASVEDVQSLDKGAEFVTKGDNKRSKTAYDMGIEAANSLSEGVTVVV